MKVGIVGESQEGESRVAGTPKSIRRLLKMGFEVQVEPGAGVSAGVQDRDYEEAGASIAPEAWQADIVLKVLEPTQEETRKLKAGSLLACYISPADNEELLKDLATQGVSVIAMDCIPRISRAQKMDVLSSMANIAGYRAVIAAAHHFDRFLNGQITAAGKVDPAQVLVIGAGVAGLAAIGAAKNLGAIVRAFDTRKAVAEQIESMGAEFLTVEIDEDGATASGYSKEMSQAFIEAEMALFREQAQKVDIVICTALIPGRPAPKLWLKDMVETMRPGSVVVDLAYPRGGNCECTVSGEVVTVDGVTIVGILDQMPIQSSELYSSNLCHLLDDMGKAENFAINAEDDVIRGSLIVHQQQVNWPLPQISVQAPTEKEEVIQPTPPQAVEKKPSNPLWMMGIMVAGLLLIGQFAPNTFLSHLTVFILSIFVGWQLIWNVAHALHTPLMSVTNAVSGIILVGGMLHVGAEMSAVTILSLIAVFVASINVFGGFVVTHRMLKMFQKGN